MLIVALNAVFAGIFLSFAWAAVRRAFPLIRVGWFVIETEVEKPDYRWNVESRRRISDAARLLIGGMVWVVIAVGSAAFGLMFAYRLLELYL